MKRSNIAVIGAGAVGATTAYALMLKNVAAHIMLLDIDKVQCKGEVLDLSDALAFCETSSIYHNTSQEAGQADIIIIAAGKRQELGQSRTDLITANKKIVTSIINDIKPIKDDAIILMITNPVDILTCCAQEISDLPRNQVIGSGTYLDSQRLRGLLAQKLGIAQQSIDAYILGEHGDSQVPVWSCAHIDGILLTDYLQATQAELQQIAQEVRNRAYEIIKCKGATYYGIATCITDICKAILFDQKQIFPLSCYVREYDTCFSMPVILGAHGVESILPITLNTEEKQQLEESAQALKKLHHCTK